MKANVNREQLKWYVHPDDDAYFKKLKADTYYSSNSNTNKAAIEESIPLEQIAASDAFDSSSSLFFFIIQSKYLGKTTLINLSKVK
jgi:hypothetical protein